MNATLFDTSPQPTRCDDVSSFNPAWHRFYYWTPAEVDAWKLTAPMTYSNPRFHFNRFVPIRVTPNEYSTCRDRTEQDFRGWLRGGKSYLVGDGWTMDAYMQTYKSRLNLWQKDAFAWAKANPFYECSFRLARYEWIAAANCDFVIFRLPYQDHGGEKTYISQDGKTKYLIDED